MDPADFADLFAEGQAVTLVRRTTGAANASTLRAGAATASNIATTGVVRSYSHREADGVTIRIGDRKVLLDPAPLGGIPPDADDHLVIGSTTVPIISVRTFAPAGTPLAYDCQVRGLE